MAEMQLPSPPVRFGAFEADLRTGELRKDGVRLKFSGQPFQVLAILLQRPGEVVTREELQKRLWPDTFVDVERNLNTAVNKIREILGDSAETPKFVETLPRRGYRFIGALNAPPLEPPSPIERSETRRYRVLKRCTWVLAIAVTVAAIFFGYQRLSIQQPLVDQVLSAVPFTTLPGKEVSPALSPDGSRIAFAWNGNPQSGKQGFDLYVKAIGSETQLRLTQDPAEWISSAWSPDGTQIAFHRIAGPETGIYVVPALGGPERKLRTTQIHSSQFSSVSWSSDGRWIAFNDFSPGEDNARIFLISTGTYETHQVKGIPGCLYQSQPTFSHIGESIAFWCSRSGDAFDLISMNRLDGQPRKLLSLVGLQNGLAWSAGDKGLIYSVGFGLPSNELGEVTVATGSTKRLVLAGPVEQPTISSSGDKLSFTSYAESTNIWRTDLQNLQLPAVELAPSTKNQDKSQFSPDGKRIAFESERSGGLSVWVGRVDGTDLFQISDAHSGSGSPVWSPDGTAIAFDSRPTDRSGKPVDRWGIYVVTPIEGIPRRLITNISATIRPHWSHDGKWVYFRSYEAGRSGIYRCPASGGDAVALSRDPEAFAPQESLDGTTVYFASHEVNSVLKKVPLPPRPGAESEVEGMPRLRDSTMWTLSRHGIYFVPADAPRSMRYFDFASKEVRHVFELNKDLEKGLSVSPDGRWIMYSLIGDVSSDIMLVDHFR